VFIATWGSSRQSGGGFGYVVAAIAFAIGLRGLFERAKANSDGLWFRNQFRTYRFSWREIDELKYDVSPLLHSLSGIGRQRHRVMVRPLGSSRTIAIEATQSLRGGLAAEDVVGEAPTRRHFAAFAAFREEAEASTQK
jgi:hypothetical protein